jgi:GLPGLI family protein
MKHLILFLFAYLLSNSVFGQKALEVSYHVITNFAFNYETTAVLKTNKNKSHYIVLKSNNSPKEITTSAENNNVNIIVPDTDNRPAIYMDFSSNNLFNIVPMFNENNVLIEKIPKIDWEIIDEFKTLNKLNCQKAIGYFRGRTYTAWFSSEIPLPFGPWKLNGLPGLILEVKDDKNQVYFGAFKIDFKDANVIENYPKESEAVSLKEFVSEIIPTKFKELESLINSKTDRHTTMSLSLPNRNHQKEIIFEWEEN